MTFGHCEVPRILWKGRRKKKKKKTLVLTLGNPPKKGGKKTLVLTLGSSPEKGGEKKNPGINFGQVRRLHSEPVGKGREKKLN